MPRYKISKKKKSERQIELCMTKQALILTDVTISYITFLIYSSSSINRPKPEIVKQKTKLEREKKKKLQFSFNRNRKLKIEIAIFPESGLFSEKLTRIQLSYKTFPSAS